MPAQSELLKVIGVRGLSVFSGLVREEYLTDLRSWREASRIYREMADDSIIGTLLDAIRLPLLAADFDVPALTDAEGDKRAAEFLWENMQQMERQTWRSHVKDALESQQFGFALSEIIMEKRRDGRIWLKNLDPRGQETLHRWEWNQETDQPEAFIQRHPTTGHLFTIPLEKTLHFVFGGRKGDPQGKPILRSLFRPWLKLKYLENFEAVGIERDVGGMAVVDFPDPDKWHGPQNVNDLLDIFEDAFKNLRMDENMWLLVPPGARAQSWGSGQRTYNVREAIVAKQKEILLRFFAQFLMLEHAGLDASGLLKGSQDFFGLALKSVQQQLLETWQQQLVPLVFSFNSFPGMTGLPVITWNDAGTVDVAGLVQSMTQAIQGQILTPTRGDEEHVRSLMDLPDLPEDVGEDVRSPQAQPSFLPFAEGALTEGAMVAMYPRPEQAKQLAVEGGLQAEDLHMTLGFLGKAESLTEQQRQDAVEVVRYHARSGVPLRGKVGGIGQFAPGENGTPTVALVDVPGLEEYRQEIVEALHQRGVEVSKEHGFTPHITLKYGDRDASMDAKIGLELDFVAVSIVLGGSRLDFSAHPAGQRLRLSPDRYDRFLNDYQAELVEHYDSWHQETDRLLSRLKGEGQSGRVLRNTFDGRLNDLEVDLMQLGRRRIFEAGQLGLGQRFAHRANSPGIQLAIAELQRRNDTFLVESLMPDIRRMYQGVVAEPDTAALKTALEKVGRSFRSRVAGYAGGATVAVFETQRRAGTDENAERRAQGLPPIQVKWVLDPRAEHCQDDPNRGTFGCPGLARVYPDGFDSLVTVPAGNVSCLGQCKCTLEISLDGGATWERP